MCRMKTMLKSFALIAIAALSLAACSKKEAPINDENEVITLKFNIKNADDAATRALLAEENGKKFLNWENEDKIGTFSVGSFPNDQTTSNNNPGTVNVSGDNYTLNVQTFNAGTVTNIYSYYPYSAAAGKDKTAAVVSIPSNQFMNADGFDADAMPMVGAPVTVDLTIAKANTDTPCGTINFSNLGSIINFKIYSSTDTDETLTSVKYIAGTGNLGGSYTIDLTAIDGADETTLALVGEGSDAEITTTHRATPVIGTGKANAIDVYMVVAPGSYSGTQVVVTTSEKTYTLTASGTKTYTRSSVKPMYVDIQNGTPGDLPAEENWTKVTRATDFTPGTYYILRADGAGYVSNAKATNAPPAFVPYTAGDPITSDMRWTATVSGSGLVFESAANEGFTLGSSNIDGKANTTRVTNSYSGTGARNVWSFETITVSGNTYYTATLGNSKYLVSYGITDWRYYGTSNINETNIPAEFYKLSDGTTPVTTTYSITIDDGIENGEVTASKTTEIEEGESITLTITPADGYELEMLTVGSENVTSDVVDDEYTFNMPANNVVVTATFKEVQTSTNDGSLEHPYSASEARTLALNGDTGSYYIYGTVTKIQNQYSASYGTANFWIDENGKSQSVFEAYKIKYFGEVNWVESNAGITVGDQVIIYGTLTVYTSGSNSTPETSSGYLVSLNGKSKGLTLSTMSTTPDNDNKQITVTWGAATGTDSAIRYEVSCGTQTFTANAAGSYTFTMADYGQYSVSVVASADDAVSATATATTLLTDPSSNSTTVTYSSFTYNSTDKTVSGGDSIISILQEKGTSANDVGNYTSPIRFYKGHTLTITCASGYTITNVSFHMNGTYTMDNVTVDGEALTNNAWSGSASEVIFVNGGNQTRFDSITVTYE